MVSAGAAACEWAAKAGTGNAAPLPRCSDMKITIVMIIALATAASTAADADAMGEGRGGDAGETHRITL